MAKKIRNSIKIKFSTFNKTNSANVSKLVGRLYLA